MVHVLQHGQRLLHDLVLFTAFYVGHKADATGVVFEARMVQALRRISFLWGSRVWLLHPPILNWLFSAIPPFYTVGVGAVDRLRPMCKKPDPFCL